MPNLPIDATGAPRAAGYAQAMKVGGGTALLFVSGQIGMDGDASVPRDFEEQCRLASR